MDSIPLEKAKLSEFGKNRTACYGKSHADDKQVPQRVCQNNVKSPDGEKSYKSAQI